MGLASRGLCPPLESAEGTWARLFGGAVRRRRWEQTVSARTHTPLPEGGGRWGKNPSALKLGGGLERAGPVPPEQQLHSRRG